MQHQTNERIVPLKQAIPGDTVDHTCSFCGNHMLFVDFDEHEDTAILACPYWVAAMDNLHDSFNVPIQETGMRLS